MLFCNSRLLKWVLVLGFSLLAVGCTPSYKTYDIEIDATDYMSDKGPKHSIDVEIVGVSASDLSTFKGKTKAGWFQPSPNEDAERFAAQKQGQGWFFTLTPELPKVTIKQDDSKETKDRWKNFKRRKVSHLYVFANGGVGKDAEWVEQIAIQSEEAPLRDLLQVNLGKTGVTYSSR